MFTTGSRQDEKLTAMDEVRAWTRRRFGLAEDAPVLVAELTCTLPGCPPLETAIAFWTPDERRHQFKLLKPVVEVGYEDLAWLIGSLTGHDNSGWDCC
jgi:hypothetical protein